jgi:hypothetical protein
MQRALWLSLAVVIGLGRDVAAQSWIELTPPSGPAPAARRNASAILDAAHNRMVIFGGFSSTYLNDIWGFNLSSHTWTNLTPASGPVPAPRLTPASVYDPDGHRMVTWSGQGQGVFFNDVWAFDLNTNTWSQLTPTGGPPQIRYGVGCTWDPKRKELVNLRRLHQPRPLRRCVASRPCDPIVDQRLSGNRTARALPARSLLRRAKAPHDHVRGPEQLGAARRHLGARSRHPHVDRHYAGRETERALLLSRRVRRRQQSRDDVRRSGPARLQQRGLGVRPVDQDMDASFAGGLPPSQRAGSAAIYDRDVDGMVIFGGNDGAVRNDVWCITELSSTVTHAGPVLPSLELRSFPNPFNPTTTVEYVLPASGHVTMRVYDTNGALVRAIVNETQSQGAHRVIWNGRNDAGVRVASGVYLLRIQSAGHAVTRKITLLK